MPSFNLNESSEDSFSLTTSSRRHLSTGNSITISTVTNLRTFVAAHYTGTQSYALDPANAQLFLNGNAFVGYLLTPGLGHITLPAGTYYLGSLYSGSLSAGDTAAGFVEVSALSATGATFINNIPMGVGGNAGAWSSQGFTVTGAPFLYVETEGTGGKFMVMTDSQYQSFQASYANGYTGGSYSFIYTMGPGSGGASLELEGQMKLPAGSYHLLWLNDTQAWQGGAADISGYVDAASGATGTLGGGNPILPPPPPATGNAALQASVQAEIANVLRAPNTAFATQLLLSVGNGQTSEMQAVAQIIVEARNTTSVATLSYEFFTGKAPSAGGMDFLVSPTGPNPNNLNSAYYQSFGLGPVD